MPYLSAELFGIVDALREETSNENAKNESLNSYLELAIESLTSKLNEKPQEIASWLENYKHSPSYPFPFLIADNLTLRDRADPKLYEKLIQLCSFCRKKLMDLGFAGWEDDELLKTIQAGAKATLKSIFTSNLEFFNQLNEKLQTPEIGAWLEEQKNSPNYSYPFVSQYRVLDLMHLLIPDQTKLKPHINSFKKCVETLKEKQLDRYLDEKYPSDHPMMSKLMVALDQLENIDNLQKLLRSFNS
jgi:hypothetical protein